MYLVLQPAADRVVHGILLDAKGNSIKEQEGTGREILQLVDALVGDERDTLLGIGVVMKTGPFTDTRLAATLANTWKYALGLPIVALDEKAIGMPAVEAITKATEHYISAAYSGMPHIGKAKNHKIISS